tara:strand:+ start:15749 stop:15985 length:237 start_codon:yes stop_codon:yes gene_type:complete
LVKKIELKKGLKHMNKVNKKHNDLTEKVVFDLIKDEGYCPDDFDEPYGVLNGKELIEDVIKVLKMRYSFIPHCPGLIH